MRRKFAVQSQVRLRERHPKARCKRELQTILKNGRLDNQNMPGQDASHFAGFHGPRALNHTFNEVDGERPTLDAKVWKPGNLCKLELRSPPYSRKEGNSARNAISQIMSVNGQ